METTRKFLLASALLLSTLYTLNAQMSLGLRSGTNFQTVRATNALDELAPDFKTINTFNIAAVAEFAVSDLFAIQAEPGYTRKGFGLSADANIPLFGTELPLGATAYSKFDYLEMPLLAKVKFGGETLQAYAVAGPSFGYALDGRIDYRAKALFDLDLGSTDLDLDAIDYQRFEIGAVGGLGLNVKTNIGQFFADARYHHGFTELYDIPVVEDKVRNQGFSLNAGFLFPL